MVKHDAVTNGLLAVIDSWQEYLGGERMSDRLCKLIEQHMEYVFVAGFDEIACEVLHAIDRFKEPTRNNRVSKTYIKDVIKTKYKENEIKFTHTRNS